MNRYAAGGAGCSDPDVEVRYVVMNPSSYLYVNELRSTASGGFGIPGTCAGYDDYKYGLRDLNTYMGRVGEAQLRDNLFSRATYYLSGEDDTSTSGSLDTSCSGNVQGVNRRERYQNYRAHAELFEAWTESEFISVPGIGHSSSQMLLSEAVREVTFRSGAEPPTPASLRPPVLLDVVSN